MSDWQQRLDRAITLFNDGDDAGALATLEPVAAAAMVDSPSPDPHAFAGALYLQGLILHQQQQHEAAFDRHAQCIERFIDNHHPVAKKCVIECLDGEVIAEAVRRHPALIARLPAAHHALRLPSNFEMLRTIDVDMADATDAEREAAIAALRDKVLADDARASMSHERARAILRRHFDSGEPFGLYLRTDSDSGDARLDDATLSFIALANGTNFTKDVAPALPKLEVASAYWPAVVEALVGRASRVVSD